MNRMLSLPICDVQQHKKWKSIKLTARNNTHSHPPPNKFKTQHTEKTQPTVPPHIVHKRHKIGHLHTLVTANQKNQQPIQKHMSKLSSKVITQLHKSPNYIPQQYPPLPVRREWHLLTNMQYPQGSVCRSD